MFAGAAAPQQRYGARLLASAFAVVLVLAIIVIGLFASGVFPSKAQAKGDFGNTQGEMNVQPKVSPFNIELRYTQPVSPSVADVFAFAKRRWERIITNEVDTVVAINTGQKLCGHEVVEPEIVNDLIIFVNVAEIDGIGNILANAGPCGLDSLGRVRAGLMNFDIADLERLIGEKRAETVVVHEMGHVLGFGTLWEVRKLIGAKEGGAGLEYQGREGNLGNKDIGLDGTAVIEDEGGEGTARSHWKESIYGTELMTGFIDEDGVAPISLLTVRSFRDLGYSVDEKGADAFVAAREPPNAVSTSSGTLRGSYHKGIADDTDRSALGKDVINEPTIELDTFPKTVSSNHSTVEGQSGG